MTFIYHLRAVLSEPDMQYKTIHFKCPKRRAPGLILGDEVQWQKWHLSSVNNLAILSYSSHFVILNLKCVLIWEIYFDFCMNGAWSLLPNVYNVCLLSLSFSKDDPRSLRFLPLLFLKYWYLQTADNKSGINSYWSFG